MKISLLTINQFGLLKIKSTETAILNITEYLYNILDSRDICYNISVDFKKAFDTVNYTILVNKLELYGVRGLPLKYVELFVICYCLSTV